MAAMTLPSAWSETKKVVPLRSKYQGHGFTVPEFF